MAYTLHVNVIPLAEFVENQTRVAVMFLTRRNGYHSLHQGVQIYDFTPFIYLQAEMAGNIFECGWIAHDVIAYLFMMLDLQ